jgi:branched-chain amino acid transport system ATP-binding protein
VSPLLELHRVSVAYGKVEAVHCVSLTIAQGSIVTVIGPNGAGKTTLLRTIAGLVPASGGGIQLDGRTITTMMAEHRVRAGIALVPEGRRLFAGLSVIENLRLGAHLRRDGAETRRDLDRIFGFFPELTRLRDRTAGTLSGGEQQMCAIGRALMSAPRLLLVDEMSLGLAPVIVERLAAVLATINDEFGLAILLVEQDVELALEIGDHGYILDRGAIVGEGPAAELRQRIDIREAYMGAAANR